MEKYAVDKDDQVESKAADMVKSGEARNMKDARSKATANDTTDKEPVDGTVE